MRATFTENGSKEKILQRENSVQREKKILTLNKLCDFPSAFPENSNKEKIHFDIDDDLILFLSISLSTVFCSISSRRFCSSLMPSFTDTCSSLMACTLCSN